MAVVEYRCPDCGWHGKGCHWTDLCPRCSSLNVENDLCDSEEETTDMIFEVSYGADTVTERRRLIR